MNDPGLTPAPPVSRAPVPDKNEQTMGMLCHLLALTGYAIPFANMIGPLIVWMIKREQMPFVESEGKSSLNFQISMTIYHLIGIALCFIVIGFLVLPIIMIVNIVLVVLASTKAASGISYQYPFSIRFIQ